MSGSEQRTGLSNAENRRRWNGYIAATNRMTPRARIEHIVDARYRGFCRRQAAQQIREERRTAYEYPETYNVWGDGLGG